MKVERLQQVSPIFRQAVELSPDERAAFLEAACAGDAALRHDVERLISAHERAGTFIESPAYEKAAGLLTNEPAASVVGQLVEHYRIVAPLGKGGMGEVYLADDTRLVRPVALKLLSAHFTLDEEHVRRFRQEAYAASALNHPSIVTIYEIGEWQGRHFIATEFIDGITLRGHLRRGKLPLADALDIALQIAGALSAAHHAGIIHRDLKPENIMLRKDGYLKILDFGIAKYSAPSSFARRSCALRRRVAADRFLGRIGFEHRRRDDDNSRLRFALQRINARAQAHDRLHRFLGRRRLGHTAAHHHRAGSRGHSGRAFLFRFLSLRARRQLLCDARIKGDGH